MHLCSAFFVFMKRFACLVLVILNSVLGSDQMIPNSLEAISVPSSFTPFFQAYHGRTLYYESLYESYIDKKKLAPAFRHMSLISRRIDQYTFPLAFEQQMAEFKQFYIELLAPQVISNWGSLVFDHTFEQDISALKPGRFSEIVTFDAGGRIQWFFYSDNGVLKRFSILLTHEALYLTEESFDNRTEEKIPVPENLDFAIFPESVFLAGESLIQFTYTKGEVPEVLIHGSLRFASNRNFDSTIAFFQNNFGLNPESLYTGNGVLFTKMLPGRDFTEWPRLSIERIPSQTLDTRTISPERIILTYPYRQTMACHQIVINGIRIISSK